MVISSAINEVGESSSFDQLNGCSKGTFQYENDSKGIFSELLRRMNPGSCLGACNGDVGFSLSDKASASGSKLRPIIPQLMSEIKFDDNEKEQTTYRKRKRNLALRSLYEIASEKQNRVPLVCTQKYNVVPTLSRCLIESTTSDENGNDETRRITCLILNQLSLPYQNKKVMVFDNGSHALMNNMLHIINLRLQETYLCCICFMNLTYLETAVEPVLNLSMRFFENSLLSRKSMSKRPNNIDPKDWNNFPFTAQAPSPLKYRGSTYCLPFFEDSKSLVRIIESLMQDNRPFLMSKILSVEGEAVRWSVGLIRNLTKKQMHCSVIAKTGIPYLILSFIRLSPHSINKWTKDSLERMALEVLTNLALHEESKSILLSTDIIRMLRHIEGERERLGLSLNTAYILKILES